MRQSAVLFQAYIREGEVDALSKMLDSIGNPATSSTVFSFDKLSTVHFGRWLIAPATEQFKASLIYSANVDGTAQQHMNDLAEQLPEEMDAIFAHCENYPKREARNKASRLNYLQQHSRKTPTFYVGAPERTVEQVHLEAKFHENIKEFAQEHRNEWKSAKEAYSAIRDYAKTLPEAEQLKQLAPPPKGRGLIMILFLLGVLVFLPVLLLLILILFLFFEWREKPFRTLIDQVPREHLTQLKDQEDVIYQNQLSQVFVTKPGLRKLILKIILFLTNFAAKNWFVKGSLMGTPTIHFARWVFIDGGKRFVFFSNFDQSYDGYLGDFVDNNGWGLNAIYGAAQGYPRTFFLFGGGSYRLLEFLGWGRITQVQTNAWYSAYPWYGLQQIVSKTELRHGLFQEQTPSEDQIKEILKRI